MFYKIMTVNVVLDITQWFFARQDKVPRSILDQKLH
jgi:hypothetical protein